MQVRSASKEKIITIQEFATYTTNGSYEPAFDSLPPWVNCRSLNGEELLHREPVSSQFRLLAPESQRPLPFIEGSPNAPPTYRFFDLEIAFASDPRSEIRLLGIVDSADLHVGFHIRIVEYKPEKLVHSYELYRPKSGHRKGLVALMNCGETMDTPSAADIEPRAALRSAAKKPIGIAEARAFFLELCDSVYAPVKYRDRAFQTCTKLTCYSSRYQ